MGTGGNTRHLKTTLKKYLLLLPFFVFNFSTFATEVPSRPSCDQWLDPQYLHQLSEETQAWVMAQTDRAMKTWVNTDQGLQIRKQLDLNNHAGNQVDIFVDDGFNYEFRVSKSKPRGVLARNSIKLGGEWEIILDLQQLSELEGIPWSFQAAECFNDRCLVTLSKAGKDSNVVREFDLKTKTFVQDGFFLDEGLNQVFWAYEDSIYVVSENKPSRLTSTGHPKHLRLLNRNQKLEEGRILRSLKPDEKFHMVDYFTNGYDDVMVDTAHRSFNESTVYLRFGRGKWHRLPLLARLQVQGFLGNYIIFKLEKTHIRKDGSQIPKGTIISWHKQAIAAEKLRYQILWQPSDQQTVEDVSLGDTAILLQITEPTQTYLQKLTLDNGKVVKSQSLHPSGMPHLQISPVPNRKDSWWIEAQSALHSGSNFLLGKKHPTPIAEREFDFSDQYEVQHLWTDSNAEGKIPVPYLVVKSKNLNPDVPAPTIIEVYGGFDTAAAPNFSKELIDLWLRHGGVYVYAMVHGSAERGWRANDLTKVPSDIGAVDTITVAEDLIKRKITNAEHIGLNGRSAGGRWIALASLMRPDLFKAVVCTVCMLDFVSYTNWGYNQVYTSEYGDPRDPAQLPSLLKYSAMHYPVPENTPLPSYLMITSSTDDRVPPAHSRRFAKRMQDLGAEAYLLELAEGGHTLFANYNVLQTVDSAEWSFFQTKLDLKIPRSEQ